MKFLKLLPLAHSSLNDCFGCGMENKAGLRLRFQVDEQQQIVCFVRLARRFAGPPGHAHGGIIATLLDEAMSKANRVHGTIAMTRQMEVEYFRPVPLKQPLILTARRTSCRGRRNFCEAEIHDASGMLLARGKALFVTVDRSKLTPSRG